jgi:predicted dehydrogenase
MTIAVGIIGCGEIAQLMHLPFLQELPEFEIAALCDISPGTVAALADQYRVPGRYTDYRDLLADPKVQAVAICTYDHGEIVGAALAAAKHVMVEKPLAFTPAEARPLVAAAEASGQVAMVGYMKLYDAGFQAGLERIGRMGKPRAIQVHDFAGRFDRYGKLYTQVRVQDAPAEAIAAGRAAVSARIDAALGPDHAGYRDLYWTLLMLGSHDLSMLRAAFGKPERVSFARPVGETQLLAVLDFPGGVPCVVEIGVGAKYEWWDEWLSVHGDTEEVRIEFPNPYVRQAPTILRVREAVGESPSERVTPVSHDTAFRRQWRHFAKCVDEGAAPLSPLAGGLDDLELALAIIRAMPPKRGS